MPDTPEQTRSDRPTPWHPCGMLLACLAATTGAHAGGPRVVVGIPPVAGLVRSIAGEGVSVHVLLTRGRSPHSFAPTLREVIRLRQARILIFAGMPFERVLARRACDLAPQARVLQLPVRTERVAGSDHHAPPHWWLDPLEAARAARAIGDLLALVDPPNASGYRARAARLAARLERLDASLRLRLRGLEGRMIVTSSPLLDGIGRRYGLRAVAIAHEDRPPTLRRLADLVRQARREGVRTIFAVRGHPLRGAWVVMQELDARLVVIDPLDEDVPGTIRALFARIIRALDARELVRAPHGPAGTGSQRSTPR